jgi:hypothetical protein
MRLIRYLWAFPVTAVGLLVGLLAILSGGSVRFRGGVVEFSGGLAGWVLGGNRLWCGGAPVSALSQVALARWSPQSSRSTLRHSQSKSDCSIRAHGLYSA